MHFPLGLPVVGILVVWLRGGCLVGVYFAYASDVRSIGRFFHAVLPRQSLLAGVLLLGRSCSWRFANSM